MTDMTQKERCTRGCIWLGAGVGIAFILMFWLIAGWGILLSLVAGGLVGVVAMFGFSTVFCGKVKDESGDDLVPHTVGGTAPKAAPAAKPATPDDAQVPVGGAATEATAGTSAAVSSQKESFSGIKPSKELKGQQELAARKGSYKYEAPAAAKAAPKPAAKPAKAAAAPAAVAETPAQTSDTVAESKPETLSAARAGGADDLKLISGVGPKLEETLNELGFYHFDQVAKWDPQEIAWVDARLRFKGRILRDDWMAQAKKLAAVGETEPSARKKK